MADYFDWSVRTDRDGQPAGVFTDTPFPVTEGIGHYHIRNDEDPNGTTEYSLGTVVFADNQCSAGVTYDPATRTLGSGSYTNYTTISSAITASGTGNKTILIRSGTTYSETLTLSGHYGTDNTHRFQLIGYNNERPIISGPVNIISFSSIDYLTLQRVKVIDNTGDGVTVSRGAPRATFINLIDVWAYNNTTESYIGGSTTSNAGIFIYDGVDDVWVHHCTSEHSYMKGFKFADDIHNVKIEWNLAKENGYWPGIPNTPWAHAYNYDGAGDSPGDGPHPLIFRYNVGYTALYGSEVRYSPGFDIHHNELYDPCHADDFSDDTGDYTNTGALHIFGTDCSGLIRSNLIHDNTDSQYPSLLSITYQDSASPIYIYNNVIYGTTSGKAINFGGTGYDQNLRIWGNTIYQNNSNPCIYDNWSSIGASSVIQVKNNIIHQAGSGSCISVNSSIGTFDYNLYYFPSGSRGVTAGANDVNSGASTDPLWVNTPPWGDWISWEGSIQSGSSARNAAVDLSEDIGSDSFNGVSRVAWDIGAYEYEAEASDIAFRQSIRMRF
jgi:hypothetical protein